MHTPGNPLYLIGWLIVFLMVFTSGDRETHDAARGFVWFHAKAAVIVIGLILFANWIR